jgi:hypothetical protein
MAPLSTTACAGLCAALLLALGGCGPTTTEAADPSDTSETSNDERQGGNPNDAPEISRSIGEEGGAIVFWPRISPRTDDPKYKELATMLQTKLAEITKRAFADRPVDVRPEPERVCPIKGGCKAATVGVVLGHFRDGCVAVALLSEPGESPQRLVIWAGEVELRKKEVEFRDPPEDQLTMKDLVPCGELAEALGTSEKDLGEEIEKLAAAKK